MADGLLAAQDEGSSHTCNAVCAQEHYDTAARDYLDRLREMTAAQADAHFRKVAWLEAYQPEATARCSKCGDTVLELRWSREHTSWQCLEPSCRNQWEWRKR